MLFTTRAGGVSQGPYASLNLATHVGDNEETVRSNRARVAALARVPPECLVAMQQVHGTTVAVVDRPGRATVADALVTTSSNLVLLVLVADCVPLLLTDASSGVCAAVHAGRRGLADGIVAAAVGTMVDLGANVGSIRAELGPAICGLCYEVPVDLRDQVVARVPAAFSTTRAGGPALDIPAGVAGQLQALGVRDVVRSPTCTYEDDRYFSYRRAAITGRQAGVVGLP